jgi:very-short-patch-repair endonuclease
MSADFSCVTVTHVERACRRVLKDGVPAGRKARSTFLVFEGQQLPAKYVLGLAYELATGRTLGPDDYTGGPISGAILERLGFQVLHGPVPRSNDRIRPGVPLPAPLPARAGKAGLLDALRARFGDVSTEETFAWLRVPARDVLPADLARIRRALVAHRGFDTFDTPGHRLRCDFFLPSARAIVEVDERQHFTPARAVALRNYAPGINLGFDEACWIEECERIAAVDPSPPHRDEQRAYYDSVRDLLASKRGIRIIRLAETALSTPAERAWW